MIQCCLQGQEGQRIPRSIWAASILLSLCKPVKPLLALTGIADKGTTQAIISSLGLKEARVELFVSPNITNIRISIVKTKKDAAFTQLHWISDMISEQSLVCPKTSVFCNTMKYIAEVANYLLFKLGRNAYFPTGSFQMADCIIGIYYSMTWQENKERIITSLKGEGNKCVINATSALSMGVHFPDVRYVVHWGPARNLLDYHHQSGRAGRDGLSSYVVVIYHG
ncbi:PREDICTED: ATP-dependent DNA helicase RecQ-like isoform X1 [Acropora digitifera]|uniref:ATP-dependent DNA helicase RecQ-like isoform X1 n=1 Tax=Acropora digitifera TaxID=70779 RepID=UPI00077A0424|nr:PREDICTED: ATP-dependent DNA helicase RecQ-like isoform X1 [Acropora digitifera]